MQLEVKGVLEASRAINDFRTVADMLGMNLVANEDSITLTTEHIVLHLSKLTQDMQVCGSCDFDHLNLLESLCLALSADGISYNIKTYQQENQLVQTYQSD